MIPATLTRAAGFALIWWILAEARGDGWLLGGIAIIAATWASLRLLPPGPSGLRPGALVRFAAFFLRHSVQGGVQVATLAFRGQRVLRPGTLALPVHLPEGGPRALLVGTLGLMPGTAVIDLDDDLLRLHVLDTRQPIEAEFRALEAVIAPLFGKAG
jgi:multicomponent Na+:H+ antiporter subunit E